MSGIDPFNPFLVDTAAAATEPKVPGASPAWKRELERAQWAALGEHFDRSSPTSAAEPRQHERQLALDAARRPHADPAVATTSATVTAIAATATATASATIAGNAAIESPTASQATTGASHGQASGTPRGVSTKGSTAIAPSVSFAAGRFAAAVPGMAAATAQAASTMHRSLEETLHNVLEASSEYRGGPDAELADPGTLEPGAADGPAPSTREAQELPARRAMHVFTSEDGAQVFIRDSDLDPAAVPGLVARIAVELALGGTRLAALTINGRGVFDAASGKSQRTPTKTPGR